MLCVRIQDRNEHDPQATNQLEATMAFSWRLCRLRRALGVYWQYPLAQPAMG
jgi:hypothetical protein